MIIYNAHREERPRTPTLIRSSRLCIVRFIRGDVLIISINLN